MRFQDSANALDVALVRTGDWIVGDGRAYRLLLRQRGLDGAEVLEREAGKQHGDQNGGPGFRPLTQGRKAEYAADDDDVDRPVPLERRGALEIQADQVSVVHGPSWSIRTLPAIVPATGISPSVVPVESPHLEARRKSAWPIPLSPA